MGLREGASCWWGGRCSASSLELPGWELGGSSEVICQTQLQTRLLQHPRRGRGPLAKSQVYPGLVSGNFLTGFLQVEPCS